MGSSVKGFDPRAIHAIETHEWPGNVRELESRVKRGVIMADSAYITPEDLELGQPAEEPLPLNMKQVREDAERKAITTGNESLQRQYLRSGQRPGYYPTDTLQPDRKTGFEGLN